MKLTKKKDEISTIRKVWDNNKTKCYGVIGTVADLLEKGVFSYCDYDCNGWAFIKNNKTVLFAITKEILIKEIKKTESV